MQSSPTKNPSIQSIYRRQTATSCLKVVRRLSLSLSFLINICHSILAFFFEMDFKEILFFVIDGSGCVEEEDDPADSILLFHPAEVCFGFFRSHLLIYFGAKSEGTSHFFKNILLQMTLENKCAWTSQLLGLSRFWRSSFKNDCRFISLSDYCLALCDIESRYLAVLGWKVPKSVSRDLVKLDLGEKLQFVMQLVEFFLGGLETLHSFSATMKSDLLRTVFSLYPLTWDDMRVKTDHRSLFKVNRHLLLSIVQYLLVLLCWFYWFLYPCSIDWLIDWLVDWLIGWLIDWLIDWL